MSVSAVGSVNADRRPDFREAILDNNFQDTTCDACGNSFRLQPEFNYLDAGRGQWIVALPASGFPDYLAHEDHANALFETSYGKKAPAAAQTIGKTLAVRVTFGWPAVREKLLARGYDIDDATLELMKLDLLRTLPSAPLSPGIELRLVNVTDSDMIFSWLRTEDEEPLEQFRCSRDWYQAIFDDPEPWDLVRSKLVDGPFVDMQKVYMGNGRAAAE